MINLRSLVPPAGCKAGISHCQPAGPDDVRYKVPETAAIGHAAPGPSAAVADDGLD